MAVDYAFQLMRVLKASLVIVVACAALAIDSLAVDALIRLGEPSAPWFDGRTFSFKREYPDGWKSEFRKYFPQGMSLAAVRYTIIWEGHGTGGKIHANRPYEVYFSAPQGFVLSPGPTYRFIFDENYRLLDIRNAGRSVYYE